MTICGDRACREVKLNEIIGWILNPVSAVLVREAPMVCAHRENAMCGHSEKVPSASSGERRLQEEPTPPTP